jgi:hypothetical protein
MNELGPEAQEILRNGREGDNPSPADRARIRAALMATIAAGAASTVSPSANAAPEVSLPASVGTAKPLIGSIFGGFIGKGMVVVFLGAASAGAIATWSKNTSPPTVKAVSVPEKPISNPVPKLDPVAPKAPEQVVVEKPNEPSVAPSLPQDQPKAPSVRTNTNITSPKAPEGSPESADTLIAETQRLREAHGAMRGGDPEKALALLSEQSAENEGQKLRAERAAARVLALCKLGRVSEAHAEAEAFLAQNPQSPLADRVRKACPNSP